MKKKFVLTGLVSINITVEAEDMTYKTAETLLEEAATCLELEFGDYTPEGVVAGWTGCVVFEPMIQECTDEGLEEA